MVTIKEIAKKLNVSMATVSRSLNHSRLVGSELSEKIRLTADRMGYEKRNIRKHRGRAIFNIKLVLPHHDEPERALFYDFTSLIEGVRSGFRQCEINLLCEPDSPDFKPFPHKKGGDINGFMFAFHEPASEVVDELKKSGTPFAILNRAIDGLPCVASENAEGMEQIISHLVGRRDNLKPAYLSLESLGQVDEERLQGVVSGCDAHGISFDQKKNVHRFANIHSITPEKLSTLVKKHNTLICVNDILGTVVLSELERLGIAVPSDVAVTGFDDSPVRQLSRPMLTTVSMPFRKLAQEAASRLESQIIESVEPQGIVRVPGSLVIGAST
jgi:DNA-binding LacI/PurR family transcriptional regulator